jgi:spore germination protein KC
MEIDRITFPIVMGIDWDDKSQMIKVYAQVATLQSQSGGAAAAAAEKTYTVIQGKGETLQKAMLDTADYAQQSISWKHVIAVVLTNKVAEHGISGILDHLCRFREIHLNSYLFITKDNPEDLLGSMPKIQSGLPSPIIALSLISQQNTHSKVVTIKDYVLAYLTKEVEPVVPLISIFNIKEKQQEKEIEYDYKGLGAFKEDKLVGWLDENESRGLNFIYGVKNKGELVLAGPEKSPDTEITVHDLIIESKITPTLQRNKPSISIKMQTEFDIGESTSPSILNIEEVPKINLQVEAYIKAETEFVLKKAQKELKADIFGFGRKIYQKYPKYWLQNKDQWDDLFINMDIKVEVEANLRDTDELSNSLKSLLKKDEKD